MNNLDQELKEVQLEKEKIKLKYLKAGDNAVSGLKKIGPPKKGPEKQLTLKEEMEKDSTKIMWGVLTICFIIGAIIVMSAK